MTEKIHLEKKKKIYRSQLGRRHFLSKEKQRFIRYKLSLTKNVQL